MVDDVKVVDTIPEGLSSPTDITIDGKPVTEGPNGWQYDPTSRQLIVKLGNLVNPHDNDKLDVVVKFRVTVLPEALGHRLDNLAVADGRYPDGSVTSGSDKTQKPSVSENNPDPKVSKKVDNLTSNDISNTSVDDTLRYTITAENRRQGSLWL